MNLVDEIDSEEKINGIYPIIMKNIREETSAIEKAERTFETLINSWFTIIYFSLINVLWKYFSIWIQ